MSPTDDTTSNGLRLGWGSKSLSTKGPLGLVALGLILSVVVTGGVLYLNGQQHAAIIDRLDRMGCLSAIPQELRLQALRDPCLYANSLTLQEERTNQR